MTSTESDFNLSRPEYPNEMKYISIATFIERIGISRKTFNSNVLPSLPILRLGPRKMLIPESAALAWIKQRTEVICADEKEGEEFNESTNNNGDDDEDYNDDDDCDDDDEDYDDDYDNDEDYDDIDDDDE
jgi:hypothetical protein